jgi:hypothetical protein
MVADLLAPVGSGCRPLKLRPSGGTEWSSGGTGRPSTPRPGLDDAAVLAEERLGVAWQRGSPAQRGRLTAEPNGTSVANGYAC